MSRFAKTIEDSFNMVFLIQVLSYTVQLCFQGFQVFRVSSILIVSIVSVFISILFNLLYMLKCFYIKMTDTNLSNKLLIMQEYA